MRLEALATSKSDHIDALELLRGRADALAKRSSELNRLAEAWKPLYQTLSDDQKQRLRLLAVFALHEMRDAADAEQMKDIEFEDSEF